MTEEKTQEAGASGFEERVFLADLLVAKMTLTQLWERAERLNMPPAVVNGLMWIRDDAATVLADANAFVKQKGG